MRPATNPSLLTDARLTALRSTHHDRRWLSHRLAVVSHTRSALATTTLLAHDLLIPSRRADLI
jgi:hypothetical protein